MIDGKWGSHLHGEALEACNSVLGKVAAILDAFGPDEDSVPLATIARRARVTKPSTHRLLADLVATRLVERTDDGYRLGRKLFTLGMAAPEPRLLRRAARPAMRDLVRQTGGWAQVAVLDQDAVLCVDVVGDPATGSSVPSAGRRRRIRARRSGWPASWTGSRSRAWPATHTTPVPG
ncbi:helix-turn-helix domain-containing protein [Pseudonocardia sp.]|uniref:helix-turn-helix domain-containing protein n=1 Tax=Pseudonocardia sp. TaxID=60912 RepID=UPI002606326D|nr:helix-turn-helix domain-containing protein [Pseudonocardia sp.]